MANLKHIVLGALLSIGFMGCGGADFGDTNIGFDPEAYSGPKIDDSNINLTVADIAGIWDATHDVDGIEGTEPSVNEQYLVITEEGEFIEYDYRGDSFAEKFGSYANCFHKVNSGRITKKPGGGFKISFGEPEDGITISFNTNFGLQDGLLITPNNIMDIDCKCSTPIVYAPPASITPEEMDAMACDD